MKVILIRHGEARYDEVRLRKYPNQGFDLGKLSDLGVSQAEKVSKDKRLLDAELIISSPYTRALQTAAIISKNTNIKLTVENDLHEWMPDVDFTSSPLVGEAYNDYIKNRGIDTPNKIINWETYENLKKRTHNALKPYINKYKKVIVVCHGIVMTTFTHFDDLVENCGIREVELL